MTTPLRLFSSALLLGVSLAAVTGCVERKITIGSNPSGALVYLNDIEIGRTPVTVPFTWYGDYSVRLTHEKNVGTADDPVMKRYFLQTHKRAKSPPHQWLGIDLLTDLMPFYVQDDHVWAFNIPEVVEPTNEELMQRATELKGRLGDPVPLRPVPKTAPKGTTKPATRPAPATAPAAR